MRLRGRLPWKSVIADAQASACRARELAEESEREGLVTDELVAELTRIHGENHLAPKIAEALRRRPGVPS